MLENCPPMQKAIQAAKEAAQKGEVPVGAVLMEGDEVICITSNRVERDTDPTAHAELLALREGAKKRGDVRLVNCDLYVTLEPCAMCAQAIAHARIRRVYYGAYDPKGGGVDHGAKIFGQKTCHHKPEVYSGIQETECSKLLKEFFADKRIGSKS